MEHIKTFIMLVEAVVSLGVLIGFLWGFFRFLTAQKEQDVKIKNNKEETEHEIKNIKEEQQVMMYALQACLGGLIQLGANGEVTEAHRELTKYINKAAHRE